MRPLFRQVPLAVLLAAAIAATGCSTHNATVPDDTAATAAVAPTTNANADFDAAIDGFITGYFEHNPVSAASAGKHEYDGKLPDWSPAGLKATGDWLHAQRDRFAAFGDDRLDAQHKFRRDYALAVIDGALFWLEDSGFAYGNPAFYTGDLSPSMYLTRPYAPLPQRMDAFIRYQQALPTAIAQMKANLRTPLPATWVDLGVNTFGTSFLKNVA